MVPAIPFSATVAPVTATQLRWSYRPGCPVAPAQLRRVRLRYWGFDDRSHTGALVVNEAVTGAVIAAFRRLYGERFPIRRMVPIDAYHGSDDRSMAADNTSAFNCRYAVAPGPKQWSVHAYGEAIDVNPVENPYLEGGACCRQRASRILDRSHVRPGMAVHGGALVRGVRARRLAVGRTLDGLARLPALLLDRRLARLRVGLRMPTAPIAPPATSSDAGDDHRVVEARGGEMVAAACSDHADHGDRDQPRDARDRVVHAGRDPRVARVRRRSARSSSAAPPSARARLRTRAATGADPCAVGEIRRKTHERQDRQRRRASAPQS